MNTKFAVYQASFNPRTRNSGFRLNFVSEIGVVRGSVQPVFVEPLIAFAATLVNFAEAFGHLTMSGAIRLKRGRLCHFAVPILRPDAIGFTQSRRPGKHGVAKLDSQCAAEQPQ